MEENKEKLKKLRHSAAHLLAAAVMEFYPDAKRAIGPATDDGFYFDFGNLKVSEDDFAKLENKMHQLSGDWLKFEKVMLSKEEAKKEYPQNPYKLELINQFAPNGEDLSFYQSGDYRDLCEGGHTDNPKEELKYFKLLSVAGAYWRGSEKNDMLTRIYGTIWPSKEELDQYLLQLEEAKKRDHRKLGKELDLFLFSELVGGGLPLWTPKGTIIREELNNFVTSLRAQRGYQKVTVPHITKKDLYETSGHWAKFSEELFKIETREGNVFAMKPMNCPHHAQIYSHIPRSYRDLPQRYMETTMVYRDEQSGELSGLSRVRCITQDDAHVFCRKSQIKQEFFLIWDIVDEFYKAFGFDLKVRLSFHDPEKMQSYLGTPEIWKEAEDALRNIAKEKGVEAYEASGEAAMYGPKIDFIAKDSIGRDWQVATIQLDFNQPERFNLVCVNEEGKEERIVMLHAAIMGSIERFMSILIEHYAGAFPTWLSPTQVMIVPITDRHTEYGQKLLEQLLSTGIRAEMNSKSEKMQAKIREAQLQKIPYMLIIGDREIEEGKVAVRTREGVDLGAIDFSQFLTDLKQTIAQRG